jgi:hypothetical protein
MCYKTTSRAVCAQTYPVPSFTTCACFQAPLIMRMTWPGSSLLLPKSLTYSFLLLPGRAAYMKLEVTPTHHHTQSMCVYVYDLLFVLAGRGPACAPAPVGPRRVQRASIHPYTSPHTNTRGMCVCIYVYIYRRVPLPLFLMNYFGQKRIGKPVFVAENGSIKGQKMPKQA